MHELGLARPQLPVGVSRVAREVVGRRQPFSALRWGVRGLARAHWRGRASRGSYGWRRAIAKRSLVPRERRRRCRVVMDRAPCVRRPPREGNKSVARSVRYKPNTSFYAATYFANFPTLDMSFDFLRVLVAPDKLSSCSRADRNVKPAALRKWSPSSRARWICLLKSSTIEFTFLIAVSLSRTRFRIFFSSSVKRFLIYPRISLFFSRRLLKRRSNWSCTSFSSSARLLSTSRISSRTFPWRLLM